MSKVLPPCLVIEGEVKASRLIVEYARTMGFKHFQLEGDSLFVIQALKSPHLVSGWLDNFFGPTIKSGHPKMGQDQYVSPCFGPFLFSPNQ